MRSETPRERPATIHDVAAQAGVSAQTVSRLLRGVEGIRPATRHKVEAAIADLGWRPNRAAQLLRTRRSYRLGALVHEMFAYGPATLVRGATTAAREAGYSLSVVGVDGADSAAVEAAFTTFQEEQVAGIIAVTLTDDVRGVVEERALEVPVVLDPAEAVGAFETVSEAGGIAVARHLLALGHRKVAMVNGPLAWLPARQRRESFLTELTRGGGSCQVEVEGDWSPQSGAQAATQVADSGATAVFTANDAMAIGCMSGLHRLGLHVPRDLSVVGFDDVPEAAFTAPELTTYRAPFEAEGREAVRLLLARIHGRDPVMTHDRTGQLIHRASSAPPS